MKKVKLVKSLKTDFEQINKGNQNKVKGGKQTSCDSCSSTIVYTPPIQEIKQQG